MPIKASASITLTRVNDADSIDIGGRNFFYDSDVFITKDFKPIRFDTTEVIKILNEGKYTLSFYVELKNVMANDENDRHRVGLEFEVVLEDNTKDYHGLWINFDKTPTTFEKRISKTFDLKSTKKIVNISTCGLYVQRVIGDVIRIGKPKLEKGNRPSDWTPAPEDILQDAVDHTNNAVSQSATTITENYKTLIDQTSKDITAMVNKVKETSDGNTTSITSLSNQLQITSEMAQFVKTTTENLQQAVDGKLSAEEVKEWARFDGATLELGASNQPFKCRLSTTELAFYQGENKVAWISNNELNILTAIIAKSIGCGNFTFVDEGALGFSLI